MREQGWSRIWDDETKNPWLISPDHSVVVGYDDAESVAIKTEWAMKQGFRGVFFWQIAADRMANGTNPLQEASRKKLDESHDQGAAAKIRRQREVTSPEPHWALGSNEPGQGPYRPPHGSRLGYFEA